MAQCGDLSIVNLAETNLASRGVGSVLWAQVAGFDEQESWKDGDNVGQEVERGGQEEEAERGHIPLWAQGSYVDLSLPSLHHPLLNRALPTVR